jgi:hypothetical protein
VQIRSESGACRNAILFSVCQNQREGLRQVIVTQSLNVIRSVALSGRLAYWDVSRGVETPGLGIMSLRDKGPTERSVLSGAGKGLGAGDSVPKGQESSARVF